MNKYFIVSGGNKKAGFVIFFLRSPLFYWRKMLRSCSETLETKVNAEKILNCSEQKAVIKDGYFHSIINNCR